MCTKVAVMAKGQIRVLGSRQYLKDSFGAHFEIAVKFSSQPAVQEDMAAFSDIMINRYPSMKEVRNDRDNGSIAIHVVKEEMRISSFFDAMNECLTHLKIEYYSIDQPSLEQVFIETIKPFNEAGVGAPISPPIDSAALY